jgi:hypothetical protein
MNSIGKLVLKVNPREKMPSYFVGNPFSPDSLQKTIRWLYFNEAVHFFLVFVTAAIGYFCISRGYHGGAILMGFMIFLNIGLVLMQHMNRIRITRAIAALKKRHERQIY